MRVAGTSASLLLVVSLAATRGGECAEVPGSIDSQRTASWRPHMRSEEQDSLGVEISKGLRLQEQMLELHLYCLNLGLHSGITSSVLLIKKLRALTNSQSPPRDKLDWAFRLHDGLLSCALGLGLGPMLDASAPSYAGQLGDVIYEAKQALAQLAESLAGFKLELAGSLKKVDQFEYLNEADESDKPTCGNFSECTEEPKDIRELRQLVKLSDWSLPEYMRQADGHAQLLKQCKKLENIIKLYEPLSKLVAQPNPELFSLAKPIAEGLERSKRSELLSQIIGMLKQCIEEVLDDTVDGGYLSQRLEGLNFPLKSLPKDMALHIVKWVLKISLILQEQVRWGGRMSNFRISNRCLIAFFQHFDQQGYFEFVNQWSSPLLVPPSYDAWLEALQELRAHLEASLQSPSTAADSAEGSPQAAKQDPYLHLAVFFDKIGWASAACPDSPQEINVLVQRLLDAANQPVSCWNQAQIQERIQSIQNDLRLLSGTDYLANFDFTPPNFSAAPLERDAASGYADLEQLEGLYRVISWLVDRFEFVYKVTLEVTSKLESTLIFLDSHKPGESPLSIMIDWAFQWLVLNLEQDLVPFAQRFRLDIHPRGIHLDIPYLGCQISTSIYKSDFGWNGSRLPDEIGPEDLARFRHELGRVVKDRIDELRFRAAVVRLASGLLGGTEVCPEVFYSKELYLVGRTLEKLKPERTDRQGQLEAFQRLCAIYNEYRAVYMKACAQHAPQCGVTLTYDEQHPEYPLLECE